MQIASRAKVILATGPGLDCSGDVTQKKDCGERECLTDCKWGKWSSWGPCSKHCDGTHIATRMIERLATSHGKSCSGAAAKTRRCTEWYCSSKHILYHYDNIWQQNISSKLVDYIDVLSPYLVLGQSVLETPANKADALTIKLTNSYK